MPISCLADRLSFTSVESGKNYLLLYTGGHMTSCNQGLSPSDKGETAWEQTKLFESKFATWSKSNRH